MQTFLEHKFPPAHRLWLEYIARTDGLDPRLVRAELFGRLPEDFRPEEIDSRFYRNDKLTALGRRVFKADDPNLANAEKVALAIRDEILRQPGINEITLPRIAELSELSKIEAHAALGVLTEIAPFFSGSSAQTPSGRPTTYFLTGSHGYDAPLAFKTLDLAMASSYKNLAFGLGAHESYVYSDPAETSRGIKKQISLGSNIKRATAFVIMAMDPARPELTDVLETIRGVCAAFGINAHRADEIQHQDQITNVILEEIHSCEYLIADLTHERPNVYYEIGYAHAMNKKPILFRRQGTSLHFDLSVHNVPEYKNNAELKQLLTKRLEAILGRSAA
jgi:hypothetical protein